ncbi:unnamed protein product [marine sediment metagenome]|uniref:Uncharacterized protein n=1 Tax=marine sediment metagenome TaxID=412755 RepID=X1RCP1_9ZZZZ
MNYIWILIIVLYIVLTHLVAKYIGAKRKIGYGKTVFWSLLFSPIIIALIIAKFSPLNEKQ